MPSVIVSTSQSRSALRSQTISRNADKRAVNTALGESQSSAVLLLLDVMKQQSEALFCYISEILVGVNASFFLISTYIFISTTLYNETAILSEYSELKFCSIWSLRINVKISKILEFSLKKEQRKKVSE